MKNKLLLNLILISILFTACNEADVEVENIKSTVVFNPYVQSNINASDSKKSETKSVTVNLPDDGSIQPFIDYMTISIVNTNLGIEHTIEETFNFVNDDSGVDEMSMDIYVGENTATFTTDEYLVSSDSPKENQNIDPTSADRSLKYDDGDGLTFGSYSFDGTYTEASAIIGDLREADPFAPYTGEVTFTRGINNNLPVDINLSTEYGRVVATFETEDIIRNVSSTIQASIVIIDKSEPIQTSSRLDSEVYMATNLGAWIYFSNEKALAGNDYYFEVKITIHPGSTSATTLVLTSKTYTIEAAKDQWLEFIIGKDDIKQESYNSWNFTTPWDEEDSIGDWN